MAWKNFQNGYPLYASELNNYLMKQSVAVFASAAERDSVLTAPTEGQVIWLQDTNAFKIYNGTIWTDINDNTDAIQKSLLTTAGDTIYATGSATPARLGLGTTGQVLTSNGSAPYWATPAGGGGYTLLSTTTLSGTTTISSISQSYKHLFVLVERVNVSANTIVFMDANTSSSNFGWMSYLNGSTPGSFGGTGLYVHPFQLTAGDTDNVSGIHIYNYTNTTAYKPLAMSCGKSSAVGTGGGFYSTNSAITALVFRANTGSIVGGTVKIYGVN